MEVLSGRRSRLAFAALDPDGLLLQDRGFFLGCGATSGGQGDRTEDCHP
jgi:hypothetical protein